MAKKKGELELFKQIWRDRPHKSQVSGAPISEFSPVIFSHILSKGAYPGFRLYRKNIWIITPGEHYMWEHGDRKRLMAETNINHKMWRLKQKLHDELVAEYHTYDKYTFPNDLEE